MATEPCQRCVRAHVKCDGTLPCSRCKALKTPCLARTTKCKSQDEPPALQRRHRPRQFLQCPQCPSSPAPTLSPSPSSSSLQSRGEAASSKNLSSQGRELESTSLSIDEQLSPSLAVRAINNQQTQVYADFIMCCFPCIFKCTENRVPVTCIQFVEFSDRRRGAMNTCFDWALRALTSTYTGLVHNDHRYVEVGASSYVRALRALTTALSDTSSAKSDEILATAIGLAIYEKYASSNPGSWIQHAAGIKALMRLRGPKAHLYGYSQAMYLAYRNFFITAALITGEECFLEEPEWQELEELLVAQNAKQPDSSVYTDIIERGFREIVKAPGYVKRVRETLVLPPKKRAVAQSGLLQAILASRAALRGVHTELGVSISMIQAGHQRGEFTGPVPYHFFDGFSTRALSGIRSGILLLNHLLSLLDPAQRPAIEVENCTLEDRPKLPGRPIASLPTPPRSSGSPPAMPRLLIEPNVTTGRKESMTTDWMDRVMTTMGMDGVRISLLDE